MRLTRNEFCNDIKISILCLAFVLITAYSFTVLDVTPTSASSAIPRTGQIKCYNESGTEIACLGTGQDGELQKGIAWPNPRFIDNSNGTITDMLTGLIWLKDASCFGLKDWYSALLSPNSGNIWPK